MGRLRGADSEWANTEWAGSNWTPRRALLAADRYAPRMTAVLAAAASAAETVDTGVPPIVWGISTLVFFMALLAMTLAFGKGRG